MNKDKAEGLLRLKLNGVMEPFVTYGLDVHIPPAIKSIVDLAKEYHENIVEGEKEK